MATASGGETVLGMEANTSALNRSTAGTSNNTIFTCPAGRYARVYVQGIQISTSDDPGPGSATGTIVIAGVTVLSTNSTSPDVSTFRLLEGSLPTSGPFHLQAGDSFSFSLSQGNNLIDSDFSIYYGIYEYAAP